MTDVTTKIRNEFGFTSSGDPLAWCVCKGLSKLAVSQLQKEPPLHPAMARIRVEELSNLEPLRLCVSELVNYPRQRLLRQLGQVLGLFMQDNSLLAPLSSIRQKFPAVLFNSDIAAFVENTRRAAGLTTVSKNSQKVMENMWLCTIEARSGKVGREEIAGFLRLHIHPDRHAGLGRQQKWIPGLSGNTKQGVLDLGHQLNLKELNVKLGKYDDVVTGILQTPHGVEWRKLWDQFITEKRPGSMPRFEQAFKFLCRYLDDNPNVCTVEAYHTRSEWRTEPVEYCQSADNMPKKMTEALRVLHNFSNWILMTDDRFGSQDEFGNDVLVRPEYYNPIRLSQLRNLEGAHRGKPPETVQMSLPLEYLDEVEKILTENDMAWPKSRNLDWIEAVDPHTGSLTRVYCPVMPYLTRLLIALPIRSGQARRLDSGEGDKLTYDLQSGKWIENQGPHANYWERLAVANPERGALRRIVDTWTGETLCGFYVNSNKTSDRKNLFDETSGHTISWQNDNAISIVNDMRVWQETWNPLEAPTRFSDLRDGVFEKMHESVAKRRPDVFYLFRYPGGTSRRYRTSPPTSQQFRMFWYEVLAELERRLKARGANPPELISTWDGNQPMSSPYTPHGLRHSGLTRLAHAGVHPWILKNIVAGHADYIMTLYYIKPNPAHVSAHLNEKYMLALQTKQEEFRQFLASRTISEVHKHAVARGSEAFTALEAIRRSVGNSAGVMSLMVHGVCPNGCTRCDEGVKLTEHVKSKLRYMDRLAIPVPNVDGVPDCTQCRFFITGTPFVDGLRIKTNEVSVAATDCAQRYQKMLIEIGTLESELVSLEDPRSMDRVRKLRLDTLKQQVATESEAMTVFAASLHSHGEMFQKVRALLKAQADAGEGNVPALLFTEEPQFEWKLLPRFEAIDELVHAAKWYPSIRAENLARERQLEVTKMLVRQGASPVFAVLTDDEALMAINAMTAYLYLKLDKASVRKLFAGHETFESLGLVDGVEETLSKAVGRPIALSIKRPELKVGSELPHVAVVEPSEDDADEQ